MRHPDLFNMDMYLEGELAPGERGLFEAHIKECPACRSSLEERSILLKAFSGLPPVEVPEEFAASVVELLPVRVRAGRRIAAVVFSATGLWLLSAIMLFMIGSTLVRGADGSLSFHSGLPIIFFGNLLGGINALVKAVVVFLDLFVHLLGTMLSMVPSGVLAAAAGIMFLMVGGLFFGFKRFTSPGVKS